mgnify:CR=1 FL=1
MENVKSCSLAELENMEQETYQLLDIRSMEAFDHGHLKDALNIPANELIERKDELQTEKKDHCILPKRCDQYRSGRTAFRVWI